jgi:formate--tetrahydrofolate ligase
MLSDIQIAQKSKVKPIREIAKKIRIGDNFLDFYGEQKAKLKPKLWEKIKSRSDGKLILVTAITPTPAGEGKTTTSIGLAQAMWKLGKCAVLALREPSLGPCLGMKGGAAGGGYAQVLPMEEINLHFTGDIHAVTAANNLLASLVDNHIYFGNKLGLDPKKIFWKRCLDLNDRALRNITLNIRKKSGSYSREEEFIITAASEIMAILCLSENITDLKERLGKIIIGLTYSGKPVFARQLKVEGAMAALLKDALKPNLVQTLENTPVLIHGGPFGNIAHGCNSVIATKYALKLGEYAITEAGFGADLGAEKLFDIKCRAAGLKPDAAVVVATIRALKYHGDAGIGNVKKENLEALSKGIMNLEKHLQNLKKFGVPAVVALNIFSIDIEKEIKLVEQRVKELGAKIVRSEVWKKGGAGGVDLAKAVFKTIRSERNKFSPLYSVKKSIPEKIEKIAKEIYGAGKVSYSQEAKKQIKMLKKHNLDKFPVCIAKTQFSLSDDPKKIGCPKNFTLNIREVKISNGAGFIVATAGKIMTMPGLPKSPAAERIDVNGKGRIEGLF